MSAFAQETFGSGEPGLVLLHGFTQTRKSWLPIATRLAEHHRVTLVDLPGHGATTSRPPSLEDAGRLLVEASQGSVLVGYSMGARIALHAAMQPNCRATGLVLIGAHPGILEDAERRLRRESDDALANRLESIGVEAFLGEWLDQPMFAGVRHLDHRDRLTNTIDGLAYALRTLGTGNQTPLDDADAEIQLPTLVMVGERDEKFRRLAERLHTRLPHATTVTIPDAGHACHLERPDATAAAIENWLISLRDGDADGQ